MIPKIIHYCWFGEKELPEIAIKCIESWKKYCPDYEIKCWNEKNIDINSVAYMREAYREKAWGFVPDVARLQIIYNEGGIYLDTDVELIKNIDELLADGCFMGFQDDASVALGLGFGSEKENPLIKYLLDEYSNIHFINQDGTLNRTASPYIQTKCLKRKGLIAKNKYQEIMGAKIYPTQYFCPISYETGILEITDSTYSIHHYEGSWLTDEEKEWNNKKNNVFNAYGNKLGKIVWTGARFCRKVEEVGIRKALGMTINRILCKWELKK